MNNVRQNTKRREMKSSVMYRVIYVVAVVAAFVVTVLTETWNQEVLENVARNLDIKIVATDNTKEDQTYLAEITLTNNSTYTITKHGGWKIFFSSMTLIDPEQFPDGPSRRQENIVLKGQGVRVQHTKGTQFWIEPTDDFYDLPPGSSRKIKYRAGMWAVARTDFMPNWYILVPGLKPEVIFSTTGEGLEFVGNFETPQQWKRYKYDRYNPFTPQERYGRTYKPDFSEDGSIRVIPTPYYVTINKKSNTTVNRKWRIYAEKGVETEALFLKEISGIQMSERNKTDNIIRLTTGNISVSGNVLTDSEDAYRLVIDPSGKEITIQGQGRSGVFYGIQTLLSVMSDEGVIFEMEAKDAPRFQYRGLLLDVSRNFRPKDDVIKLMDVMSVYKMNRLVLHLTDDEGWRLQIPGLSELTEVASKRCHSPSEKKCLVPQFGSGPDTKNSGSGFYTVEDYEEILKYAQKRHIQVIPEVAMPGHAHAAIKAMEARYEKFRNLQRAEEAREYLLTEKDDDSRYFTTEMFNDNAMNPCIESTYRFIDYVIQEIVAIHAHVQPLKVFNFGGYDVGDGAWLKCKSCQNLQNAMKPVDVEKLKELFFKRVSKITASHGLDIGGWAKSFVGDKEIPFNLSVVENKRVYAYAWNNTWEVNYLAGRAYSLANNGYKVIMSHATHLNFDHPYEPDPLERGVPWATRFTDTKKTFSFTAENIYGDIDVKRSGQEITKEDVCGKNDRFCPSLNNPKSIVGMQGQIWSHIIRTNEQLQSMVFPRMLALAERAWHCAPWESMAHKESRNEAMKADWLSFASAIGKRELPRLDSFGIHYRVPPPGAIIENSLLRTSATFPGLAVECSLDGGRTWLLVTDNTTVHSTDPVLLRTRSADLRRFSRVVTVHSVPRVPVFDQTKIDYIGEYVKIQLDILANAVNNSPNFLARLILKNTGKQEITFGNWGIWFCTYISIKPTFPGYDVESNHQMTFKSVKGCIYKLEPTRNFKPILAGEEIKIKFVFTSWRSLTRMDFFPNWYVTSQGMMGRVVLNTAGEKMSFLGKFEKTLQYRLHQSDDRYKPYSPSERFRLNSLTEDLGETVIPLIPTPLSYSINKRFQISLDKYGWKILAAKTFLPEAKYLQKKMKYLGYPVPDISEKDYTRRIIKLVEGNYSKSPEAYTLSVLPNLEAVIITSSARHGVFNGIQTLLGLAMRSRSGAHVPEVNITDEPRFEFRGLLLDVSRNFHSKSEIIKMLDVMSAYKLNKLHFHLTDSEGWRLEIPGLPELTKIGGQRCHDITETNCIQSNLGSGPDSSTSGSGFYTVSEYKEILTYAAERHIEIIPEIALPRRSHAAITSIANRRQTLVDKGDYKHADDFLLSVTEAVNDDTIDPCLNTTYLFINHVLSQLVAMHRSTNPLKTFHFGGYDVRHNSWDHVTQCGSRNYVELKRHFIKYVSDIAHEYDGLNVASWAEGLLENQTKPFDLRTFPNLTVYGSTWNSVWKRDDVSAGRSYALANAGYKVILSQATHLSFDHPYEPDPNQSGTYWATRFIDTKKVFSFTPDDIFASADVTLDGESITKTDIYGEQCIKLEQPQNIIGIQANFWSDVIRTDEQLEHMLFPRLLALAERAWHKASWENKKILKKSYLIGQNLKTQLDTRSYVC